MTHRIAVIGAGLAGLSCARVLRRAGFYVDMYESDRVVGGRMGTSRLGLVPFDHGAQYVSGRSDRFRAYLDELVHSGYAANWHPKIAGAEEGTTVNWFVGTPGMSAMVRPLAESVQVHTNRRVHTLQRSDKAWQLWFDDQTTAGPFAAVAVAVPAPEAALILGRDVAEFAEQLAEVRFSPIWALMIRLDERVLPEFDAYSDMSQLIRWVGRNNVKPGRSSRGEHIVVHASPTWTRETEDAEPELVAEELWSEVCHVLDLPPVRPQQMSAHLWKHGLVDRPLGETYLFSSELMVGTAGDWCRGRLAEQAFESGAALGRAMVDSLT
ncbi:MAG: NAD(P)/FAD-dependent oxidoreductase [Hyphomicrobiaceae bacterium]